MEKQSKEPVRLRKRKMKDGSESLYLDIYVNGNRSYEYLRLYLVPEKTRADKENNRNTLALAEAVRAKRVVEIRNGEFGFKNQAKEKMNFYDYFVSMVEARRGVESLGNWGNWRSCLKHMQRYDSRLKQRTFAEITPEWVQGFHDYLESTDSWQGSVGYRKEKKPLAKNSRASYYRKLVACLNQAYQERIILSNPTVGIEGFQQVEGTRMYLTIDEVRLLAATECRDPEVKRAFLFSCLTGLRRSDVEKLTWGEVHSQGEFTRIIFRQKKTNGQEYLDIAPEAAELMGKRGKADEKVFVFHCPDYVNGMIRLWCEKAGIEKDITFHCARHTFATMMLDIGTDIYTVSKLLGHKELSTTQIYAKVLDKNKQAAVSKIPSVLGGDDTVWRID